MFKNKSIVYILLIIPILFVSYKSYDYYSNHKLKAQRAEELALRKRSRNPLFATTITDFRKRFFRMTGSASGTQWQTLPKEQVGSAWYQKEKKLYAEISKGKTFDILVLPIQELRTSVDRVTRMLSARSIAHEIRTRTGYSVMPVEIAQRLLGERSYHFSDSDISDLVKRYKIKRVIQLFYRQEKLRTKDTQDFNIKNMLAVVDDNMGDKLRLNIFDLKPNSKSETLEISVMKNTSEIVTQVFNEVVKEHKTEKKEFLSLPPALPKTLIELSKGGKSSLHQAINLQLLGMLIPENNIYERRRFFERSLIALKSVHKESSDYNYLTSRAYFYLHRRPMAIKQLGKPGSSKEKALLAYMNGNHTELKKLYNKIKSPLFKLMAFFELSNLSERYNVYEKLPIPIGHANKWLDLAISREKDYDVWYVPDNTEFFRNLDGAFPEFDTLYTNAIKNKAAIGDLGAHAYKLDAVFETAFHEFIKNNKSSLCCNHRVSEVSKLDIALLYRTVGISNLLRKFNKYVNIQVRETSSLNLARSYEVLLDGHPSFLRLKAEALDIKYDRASDTEKTALIKDIYEKADLAYMLTAGTDKNTARAYKIAKTYYKEYTSIFNPQDKSNYYSRYISDFPTSTIVGNCEIITCLEYTNTEFRLFKSVYSSASDVPAESYGNKTQKQLMEELKTRFNGHPSKIPFQATILYQKGKTEEARRLLTIAVDNKSMNWEVYNQLGRLYVFDGEYNKAEKTFLKFPKFLDKNSDERVLLSNLAFDAASTLFFGGAAKQSRKLYKYASDLKTGSGASLTSRERLAILDKDYLTAARISLYTAQRYNSVYRYRDYLEMIHVYGLHERAQAGFIELVPRFSTSELWESHLLGERIQNKKIDETLKWVYEYKKTTNDKLLRQIDKYALTQSIIDRKLNKRTMSQIKNILLLREKKITFIKAFAQRSELITYLDSDLDKEIVDPMIAMRNMQSLTNLDTAEKINVPNRFSIYIEAYTQLKNGNLIKAYDLFRKYATYESGDLYNDDNAQLLSYFALTVSKAKKLKQFERFLTEKYDNKHFDTFDYRMAKAVIFAVKGDADSALNNLDKALALRPQTEFRINDTMYQMLEICEILYKKTKDKRYITKALKWTEYYQQVQPQVPWTYAFEAKYSKNIDKKIKAVAYTLYLDPQSEWLKAVSKKYHARAKKWWKKNNPFVLPKPAKSSKTKNKA